MQLHILGIEGSLDHIPEVPTYAIRIWDKWSKPPSDWPLKESPNYIKVLDLEFDDIWPGSPRPAGTIMFDNDLAETILRDFNAHLNRCESLIVNCTHGKNRSPAVAIALNEIFDLGHDAEALKQKYDESTWFVYHTLKKVATELDIP